MKAYPLIFPQVSVTAPNSDYKEKENLAQVCLPETSMSSLMSHNMNFFIARKMIFIAK
jgi:hypothetical protein